MNKQIVFVGLTRVDESKTRPVYWAPDLALQNDHIAKYDATIKTLCVDQSISYIELASLFTPEDYPDGLHPNAAGHEKIYQAVLAMIDSIIRDVQ